MAQGLGFNLDSQCENFKLLGLEHSSASGEFELSWSRLLKKRAKVSSLDLGLYDFRA